MKLLLATLLTVTAFAAPSGFQSANATYHVDGSGTHVITSGNKGIVQWENFSLSKGEVAKFLQTNSRSAVLNRVTGGSLSKIYGHIESNGKVFLVNRAGVLIGEGARIDCAGFLASTANIPDDAFLAGGELAFKDFGDGDIINLGTIECPGGDVVLLAKYVENSGSITAGNIYLTSGTEVLLKGDGPILVQSSLGEIRGASPYELAVKTEGKIVSQTLNEEGGKIFLVSESGKTEANGILLTSGGTVHVLGEEVVVGENAFIDVSADHGAGEVLIGGDTQGRNPHIKNAYITTTKEGAEIHADSYLSGDAGKIIVWSDTDTVAAALATARAFGESGDGGFIEASGGHGVATPTFPILTSKNGRYGTFLIDAGAITIDSSAGTGPKVWGAGPLSTALGLGSVIVDTGDAGVVGGDEIITVTGGATTVVSWSTPTTLTLIAGRNINMEADTVIENTYAGAMSFDALVMTATGTPAGVDWEGITIDGAVSSIKGDIRLTGTGGDGGGGGNDGIAVSGSITSTDGSVSLTGTGDGSSGNGVQVISGGAVSVAGTGEITILGDAIGAGPSFGNSGVNVSLAGSVSTVSGDIRVTGTGSPNSSGGGTDGIFVSDAVSAITSMDGNLFLTGFGGGTTGVCDGITVVDSAVVSTTGTGNVTMIGESLTASGNADRGVSVGGGATVSTSSGNITISGKGSPVGGNGSHGISIFSTVSSVTGAISLTGEGRGITRSETGIALGGSGSISSAGDITLRGTGSPNGTLTGQFGIVVIAATSISSAGSGNITLTGIAGIGSSASPGIGIIGASTIASSAGTISLTGIGGIGVDDNSGISLTDLGTAITSTSGRILLNGTGGGSGNLNHGITLESSAAISSSGDVTLRGTGGLSGAGSFGVNMGDTGTSLTGGTLHIIGTGGGNTQNGISIDRATITGAILGESFSDIIISEGAILSSPSSMTFNASRDLTIQGGTVTATNTSLTTGGDLLLIAGRNLSILDGTTSLPVLTSGGNMTLVADNIFPNFPSRGTGEFIAGSTALITSSGELRIYTVTPDQNTINAPLNGAPFTSGSFGVDTNTEKWVLYFNDGSYGGPNFTIYYKEGFSPSEIIASSIAISQLSVPTIQFGQFRTRGFNKISVYHAHFSPDGTSFAPYRAFIFEDDIYWTNSQ